MTAPTATNEPPRCADCNKVLNAEEIEYYGATCEACESKQHYGEETEQKTSMSSRMDCSPALRDAIETLDKLDKLPLIEQLKYCQHPMWEKLLRRLVKELTSQSESG